MSHDLSVAIIGLSCRFPGADTPEAFWRTLLDGTESIVDLDEADLIAAGVPPALLHHPAYVRRRPILRDIEGFDAALFGLSPTEAAVTDPQHRLFLECAWEALDAAGCDPARAPGPIGVFAGCGMGTYLLRNLMAAPGLDRSVSEFQVAIGNDKDFLTTRTAYKLDLTGPCVTVNTACSTSLVAVHMAVQSLLAMQCDVALAGAASVQVPLKAGYLWQEGGISSPDGHCRPFDAEGAGTVGGSGAGVVALKRLAEAIADGDPILAVIRGSAINNDGAHKIGFTAPSVDGQAQVIADALAFGEVSPDEIGYIEAHGTATSLGDPIEVTALNTVFGQRTDPLPIGSVKGNVGHLDTAAGMAGLIKTVLALQHGRIPSTLHFRAPNPRCDFGPLRVVAETTDWTGPRRAGVSSFGIGGTNAHVVVEEAPPPPATTADTNAGARPWQVLTLSAHDHGALTAIRTQLATHLETHRPCLADTAFTLQTGRRAFALRHAVPCTDLDDAVSRLLAGDGGETATAAESARAVFLFPGQGSQSSGMARDLRTHDPAFRDAFDACARHLAATAGLNLAALIDGDEAVLRQTANTQPALFAVEYALARAWISWGVSPTAMIGHSLGEWVAACLAGTVGLEDALDIVVARGRLMEAMPSGSMLAVPLTEEQARPWTSDQVALAAINSPGQCVLSGPSEAIARLRSALLNEGIDPHELATSHAFHSSMMDEAARAFETVVANKTLAPPSIPFISNVTGDWITDAQATAPAYWAQQIRATVRFADGLRTMTADPRTLIEVGPGRVLAGLARANGMKASAGIERDEAASIARALAEAWTAGVPLDWTAVQGPGRRKVTLPTYPFQRSRHWISPAAPNPAATPTATAAPIKEGLYSTPVWHPAPLPPGGAAPRSWLILSDTLGVGDAAARLLEARGDRVTQRPAPTDRAGMIDLFDALRGQPLQAVLHLGCLTGPTDPGDAAARALGLDSLILLVKGLGRRASSDPLRVVVASDYMQPVGGESQRHPAKALLCGPVLVMPQEVLNVSALSVDVADVTPAQAARLLLAEAAAPITESFVAWRDGRRLAVRMESLTLPPAPTPHPALREGAPYLIIGGLGGVGLEIAETLAEQARAKLVLVGRSGLDAPSRDAGPPAPTVIDLQPERIDRRLAAIETELAIRTLDSYDGLVERIEEVCSALLLDWLEREGIDLSAQHTVTDLVARLRILPKFVKFFDFILAGLVEHGQIRVEDSVVTVLARPEGRGKALNAALCAAYPGFAPMLELLEHCVDHYGPALAGDIEAISVLFPDGGEGLMLASAKKAVEFINARTYRVLARELIAERVRHARPGTVRILEIGGGNGVATGVIAPALVGENVEYHFTDVGKSFVLAAEQNAQALGFDFMRFGTLDISRDPAAQGYDLASFDLILGLDVVHATPSISRTMTLLKRLLKPGGAVLLLETVRSRRWDNMIGGLAEGWWYVEDDFRHGMPLMPADLWESTVRTLGFDAVEVWPRQKDQRTTTDCALILAQVAQTDSSAAAATPSDDPDPRAQRIEAMKAKGAEVMVAAADVADDAAMTAVVTEAEARFGPIRGVIHAAMDMRSGSMQLKEDSDITAELAPKVAGTLVLDRLFRDRALDFMMLCSSMSARTGGFGNAVYCAANAFMDAFALTSNRDRPTVAVAWGRWQGVGFARAFEHWHQRMTGERLEGGLTAAEGRDAVLRALAAPGLAQVAVSAEGVDRRDTTPGPGADSAIEPVTDEPTAATAATVATVATVRQRRPTLAQAFVPPEDGTEQTVARVWSEVLGIEPVGALDDFASLGGDSLIAIQVISRLRETLGIAVSVRLLFEQPTVRGLSAAISALMRPDPPDDPTRRYAPDTDTEQEEGFL